MNTVEKKKTWTLEDGRTVTYFTVGAHEFSNLPEEDFNYETAVQAAEAWAAWAEYVKNNPHMSAGATTVNPENNTTQDDVPAVFVPSPPLPEKTRDYAAGYAAGFKDGETKNAPPF